MKPDNFLSDIPTGAFAEPVPGQFLSYITTIATVAMQCSELLFRRVSCSHWERIKEYPNYKGTCKKVAKNEDVVSIAFGLHFSVVVTNTIFLCMLSPP